MATSVPEEPRPLGSSKADEGPEHQPIDQTPHGATPESVIGEGFSDAAMDDAGNISAGGHEAAFYDSDLDSGYGDSLPDAASISSRVSSLFPRHEYRHGRRYHGLHAGSYNFPDDEPEQARLEMLHYTFTRLIGDRLFLAPIAENASVLDIGTGTGAWPIHFGDVYPGASAVGLDLSPIQPQWVPANVRFAVDDVELDWADGTYDYIHCRYMSASIRDWPALVERAYRHLRPGGWLELKDSVNVIYSCPRDSSPQEASGNSPDPAAGVGTRGWTFLEPENALNRLMGGLMTACDRIGRGLNPAPSFRGWCLDAGFQQVREQHFALPVGTWPSHPTCRELGSLMGVNFTDGVDGFTARLFTDVLGWSQAEVSNLNDEVRAAAENTRESRPMFDFIVVTAQKPM